MFLSSLAIHYVCLPEMGMTAVTVAPQWDGDNLSVLGP
jgi:hypothetical protein